MLKIKFVNKIQKEFLISLFQLSSSINTDEEDIKIETDKEGEDDEQPSILDRIKENVVKPLETTAANLRDKVNLFFINNIILTSSFKLPSLNENDDEDLSLIDRTKQAAEKVITPIKDSVKILLKIFYFLFLC